MRNTIQLITPLPCTPRITINILFISLLILLSGCKGSTIEAPPPASSQNMMKWVVLEESGDQRVTLDIGPRYFTPNPSTQIGFDIPVNSIVTLTIYDEQNIPVAKILDHEYLDAGQNYVEFNASNIASGVYLYLIIVQPNESSGTSYKAVKKMMLVK
jgi:hypothetical protein